MRVPHGDSIIRGKVVNPKQNTDGNPIGVSSSNPILDTTREYEVQFPDGTIDS
jgi:hypothetical protein